MHRDSRFGLRRREAGVTLLEVLIAVAVLGIALGGLLPAVWDAVRRNVDQRETVRARILAEEICEEMAALPRERAFASARPTLATRRSDFTTLLDFDNLEESPPKDPLGEPIPDVSGLTRRVDVRFVDPREPDREAATRTDLVRVEVTIMKGEETLTAIRFLRSRR